MSTKGFRIKNIRVWPTVRRKTWHAMEAFSGYPHFPSVVVKMPLKSINSLKIRIKIRLRDLTCDSLIIGAEKWVYPFKEALGYVLAGSKNDKLYIF